MIRDAIASAIKDRWPDVKITDVTDFLYGSEATCGPTANHINVEIPSADIPDVAMRVASIDIKGDEIEATFYGGGKYSHNLYHPKSITDLEELLEGHLQQVRGLAKDTNF